MKNVQAGDYSAFTWRPVAVSKYLHMQLLPEDNKQSSKIAIPTGTLWILLFGKTSSIKRLTLKLLFFSDNLEDRLSHSQQLWDLYALLGEYK